MVHLYICFTLKGMNKTKCRDDEMNAKMNLNQSARQTTMSNFKRRDNKLFIIAL